MQIFHDPCKWPKRVTLFSLKMTVQDLFKRAGECNVSCRSVHGTQSCPMFQQSLLTPGSGVTSPQVVAVDLPELQMLCDESQDILSIYSSSRGCCFFEGMSVE